jgi:hypothetical protein
LKPTDPPGRPRLTLIPKDQPANVIPLRDEPTPAELLTEAAGLIDKDARAILVCWMTPEGNTGYSAQGAPIEIHWIANLLAQSALDGSLYDPEHALPPPKGAS